MAKRMRRMATLALLMALASPVSLHARTVAQKKKLARTVFEQAERMREALNGRPERDRTLKQYRAVMDEYRKVYYVAPTSAKADESIVSVAELLADAGRLFDNDKMLNDAIKQYEFLRREYPGSKFRVEALFTIGEIYMDDLGDAAQAKAAFQDFLKHYPKSELAAQAKDALAELNTPAEKVAKGKSKENGGRSTRAADAKNEDASRSGRPASTSVADETSAPHDASAAHYASAAQQSGRVLVTGVRHWSTPDYTRVAIDLDRDVQYTADRIDSPDRIYFDLHNAKLSSTLVGKSFEVDDGFLKKIRVAQYQPGETRVVLEVAEVSEYSAFLLPNPYRLIVDIHKKKPATQMAAAATVAPASSPARTKSDADLPQAKIEPTPALGAGKKAAEVADGDVGATSSPTLTVHKPATSERTASAPPKLPPIRPSAIPQLPARSAAQPKLEISDMPADKKPVDTAKINDGPLPARGKKGKKPAEAAAHEAAPMAAGDRTLIRALGLKIGRIVVDAGHGGHDTGTIGPNGLLEKDLVLDVALRLGKLLESRLGADVTYTRDDDTFIPLETRTAIANQKQADLFVSVHANSSDDAAARGVETYYLNFTTSKDALEVAARENAVSDQSIHELQDLVKKIALKEKVDESKEFASDVQQSLYGGLSKASPGIRNRGVKKAPFIVLIGANMPSILAEISFVSNPTDAKKLQTPEWRQKIAESLYRGVAKYVSGLSGVKVAAETKKPEGESARP